LRGSDRRTRTSHPTSIETQTTSSTHERESRGTHGFRL
jgi:hypothetical protein